MSRWKKNLYLEINIFKLFPGETVPRGHNLFGLPFCFFRQCLRCYISISIIVCGGREVLLRAAMYSPSNVSAWQHSCGNVWGNQNGSPVPYLFFFLSLLWYKIRYSLVNPSRPIHVTLGQWWAMGCPPLPRSQHYLSVMDLVDIHGWTPSKRHGEDEWTPNLWFHS